MTTTGGTSVTAPEVTVRDATYLHAVRSEWIKARSIKSTWILMGVALVLFLLIAWAVIYGVDPATDSSTSASAEAVRMLFAGNTFVLLIVAIFGSMVITSEFSTGMARNTFSATPARGAILAAKATIVSLFSLAVGVLGFGMAYGIFASYLSGHGITVNLGESESLRVFLVNQLTFVVVALLSLALGTVMRSSVGTIFTVVGLLMILPGILFVVNSTIANWIGAALPTSAASAAQSVAPVGEGVIQLNATAGLITLVLWAVLPIAGAYFALRTRDI